MSVTNKFFQTLGSLGNDGVNYAAAINTEGTNTTAVALQDPTGSGYGLVGKFGITPGDGRSEMGGYVDLDPTFETDYWTRWSVYIPSDWALTSEQLLFMQIHDYADTSPADVVGRAQLVGYVENDRVRVMNSFCASSQTASLAAITSRLLLDIPLSAVIGRWTDITLRSKWSYSGTGWLELYVNHRRVFKETVASNAYNNAVGRGGNDQPFHKCGIYKEAIVTTTNHYFLHRGIQRGTGYSTYSDFIAACGESLIELEPVVAMNVAG